MLAKGSGTEIIDATAVTAARQAGSPKYDKAKSDAPAYLFLHTHGGRVDERMGTQQGVNNIEVPVPSGKISQLWWQQQFMDDKLSALGGLYVPNTSLGLRVRGQLSGEAYAQIVVLDGVPGNPDKPKNGD
ncbi:MAG: hypothetical protein ACKVQA_04365 [Burkholderiales bacterium]